MKKAQLLLPLLAVLPLSAQTWEAGLFLGNQTFNGSEVTYPDTSAERLSPDSKVVYGLRVGASILDLGPVLLQVTAGYQPESTTAVFQTQHSVLGTDTRTRFDFKSRHASLGAMFNFKTWLAVGAGLEYRFENYELGGTQAAYARPWLRGNVGYALPMPLVKPFLGLEVAFPLATKSLDVTTSREDRVRSVAPMLQVGLYGGIRF